VDSEDEDSYALVRDLSRLVLTLGVTMKLITTIVRPEVLPEVKAALFRAGITGITLSRVSGHGGEHEIVSQYRGTTLVMEFMRK